MPVKKTNTKKKPLKNPIGHDCCFDESCGVGVMRKHYLEEFGHKIIWTLVAVFLVYVTFFLGFMIQKTIEETKVIGQADRHERSISVEADATVPVRPDIATTNIGMIAEGDSVAEAQQKNTAVMNSLIESLKALGISDDDIQTANYNVYPRYNYTEDEGQVLEGYQVSQNVTIKIRNLAVSNDVLALAGEVGANTVSGLDFTIDDTDSYIAQARDEALRKAKKKAMVIADSLGVNIISVISYDEFEQGRDYDVLPYRAESFALGGAAPQIEPGTEEVRLGVRVTFEIQ